ncbi:UNVERIFIED_CONTAM: hypothetical protein FKN15_009389 [Acipenser sinensis]
MSKERLHGSGKGTGATFQQAYPNPDHHPSPTGGSPGRDGRKGQRQPVHPNLAAGTRRLTPGLVHSGPPVGQSPYMPVLGLWTARTPAAPMPSNHHRTARKWAPT